MLAEPTPFILARTACGVIADDFTFDNLRRAGFAASGAYFQSTRNKRVTIIGYDRRFLSRSFAEEVSRIWLRKAYPCIYPRRLYIDATVSFSVVHRKAAWGIVLTASHNPAAYNGFKLKRGFRLPALPEVTREIEFHSSTTTVPDVKNITFFIKSPSWLLNRFRMAGRRNKIGSMAVWRETIFWREPLKTFSESPAPTP